MNNVFNNLYKGKKVLLTGHTGFKGAWLWLWLKELGAEVLGYSLPPNTSPNLFEILQIDKDSNSIYGDIRDLDNLKKVMNDFKPEFIFHLAAQPLVRVSYENPKLTYETNVMGTLNLYEAIRECNSVKTVVIITTDKCYENKEWVYSYRETDPMGGYDPYSSSKGCVEILTSSYRDSYFKAMGIGIATARAGNVIGGGDWAKDRLIPDLVRCTVNNVDMEVRNPNSIRPWQHVLEPLSGYLWLGAALHLDKNKYSTAWNFGPNNKDILTVCKVIEASKKYWRKVNYIINNLNNPHEANLLALDITKAMSVLQWQPNYDINTTIKKTMEWYKTFYEDNAIDIIEFTKSQINDYISEAKLRKTLWSVEGE